MGGELLGFRPAKDAEPQLSSDGAAGEQMLLRLILLPAEDTRRRRLKAMTPPPVGRMDEN